MAQLQLEKVRGEHALEIGDLRRKHERSMGILQGQMDLEAESLRRTCAGEQLRDEFGRQSAEFRH